MGKRRSRRLRKKLRLGEFQELGFSIRVDHDAPLTPQLAESFVDALLAEVIEPRGLAYGGWASGGFVTRFGRGSVTAEEREAMLAWLRQRPGVAHVNAGELVDAWYHEDEDAP